MNKHLSLVFVMLQLKMGGGNRVIPEIVKRLQKTNSARIITGATRHGQNVSVEGIEIQKIGLNGLSIASRLATYICLFLRMVWDSRKREVLVYSDPMLVPLMILLPWRKAIRYIQADDLNLFSGNPKMPRLANLIYKYLMLYSYRYCRHPVICNSVFISDCYRKHGGRAELLGIVNPGIDLDNFYIENPWEARPYDVAILARDEPIKGLSVFAKANEKIQTVKWDGGKTVKVAMFANRKPALEINNAHFFLSNQDAENRRILNLCKIFVYPSFREGYGLPPLEAMACGCLVVSSDCGGVREYGVQGKNLLFFPVGDVEALSRVMISVIKDPESFEAIRKNGIETAFSLNWNHGVNQFTDCLNKYMKRSSHVQE